MTAIGIALLVVGVVLAVAEAHAPSGALGVAAGIALIVGGIMAIVSVGGAVALAVPVGIVLGAMAGGWTLYVTREIARSSRGSIRAGTQALSGRVGEVRRWENGRGQVFVDGALWRARRDPMEADSETLREGDPVVVDRVNGLTLCVHRADEWEMNL